jgi:hypothetical protein
LGNVEEQTLEEIWFGEKHAQYLESIMKNMRNDIKICRGCDMIPSKIINIERGVSPEFLDKLI